MIALLPMKGHSERVPGKNIKHLAGKPLFFHIGDTLKTTKRFEKLVINTDSINIADFARERYGNWIRIIDRPPELMGDYVSMNKIIAHDINVLGSDNTYFQTHSTNPLLSTHTIHDAINKYNSDFKDNLADSLFSVNELRTRLYTKDLIPINHNPCHLGRTQDLDIIYEENSSFFIFSGKSFLANNHRIGVSCRPYIMKRNSMEWVDIDDSSEWDLAEKLLQLGQIND